MAHNGFNSYRAKQLQKIFGRAALPCNADKSPRTSWKLLQTAPASDEMAELLFAQAAPAIAIICGGDLAALDIDNQAAATEFQQKHPELCETRCEKTPRGVHLFYRVAGDVTLTAHWRGADFLHDGSYVIVAPSPGYVVEVDLPIRELSNADHQRIVQFFNPLSKNEFTRPRELPNFILPQLTPVGLKSIYLRKLQATGSRNQALFQTASYARSCGCSQDMLAAVLVDVFAASAPAGAHKRESERARIRESERTIASAYNRAPYVIKHILRALPAAAHQALSQRKLTAAARMLDIIYKNHPGQSIQVTQHDMRALATDWGTRRTVEFLESANLTHVSRLPPRTPPQKTAIAETKVGFPTEKQCKHCIPAKPTKTPNAGGRPQFAYAVPSVRQVCDWLGVACFLLDSVSLDDLQAKTPLRLALLRGLLARCARSSQFWQALVFGVHISTIQRWHNRLGVIAVYPGHALTGRNLDSYLPDEERIIDHWIQDSRGRRYPALRAVAARLWAKGKRLTIHNRYTFVYMPRNAPKLERVYQPLLMPETALRTPPRAGCAPAHDAPAPATTIERPPRWLKLQRRFQEMYSTPPPPLPPWRAKWGRAVPGRALPDAEAEAAAQHLYNKINQRARNDKRASIDLIRSWITTHGPQRVEFVINRITSSVRNPVGYVRTVLEREE